MHDRIPFFLALRSSVRRFQMPFEGLSFVKALVKFWIIYATDPLLQNKTKIVCLRWLAFDIFNYEPCRPCWITCANLSKSGQFSARFISETKSVTFFAFLAQATHYLTAKQFLKTSIEWKIFALTSCNYKLPRINWMLPGEHLVS